MTAKRSKARTVRYRALTDMSLRQSSDPEDPKYGDWHEWPAGTVFTPPPHMNVERALQRGIMEPVKDGGESKVENDGEE